MDHDNYQATLKFFLSDKYKHVAFYLIKNNGCCEKPFFILTANSSPDWPGGINYSCQCGCGGWCTNGHGTEAEAVEEYRKMCNDYQKRRKEQ